jgi:hypothetical protein
MMTKKNSFLILSENDMWSPLPLGSEIEGSKMIEARGAD